MLAMMGTSVPLPVMRAVQAAFPHARLLQGYGLTETSPLLTLMPFDEATEHMDSIGKAVIDAELGIMDTEGRLLDPGEEGEIVGRGPMIMKGYLDDPEATAARWRHGWFHTGDAGRFDQDGFFYHLGRLDDMIVTGQGLNVFPSEIEVCLLEHPDVLEAAVVGRRDRDRGTELHAFVVLHPGAGASATELRAHCTQHLASYKVPRRVHIMPELPKNATGKVVKTALAVGA
jgi:long-chain acyl-CoA synthetase